MDQDEKVRENRLRRMAERQGLVLHKSRRRDPLALDYGRWTIVDGDSTERHQTTDLDSIEAYLKGER
jgi:hypothetical protein